MTIEHNLIKKPPKEQQILAFNKEVLQLVSNEEIPLMEKIRYARIVHRNLTELVERRLQRHQLFYSDVIAGVQTLETEMGDALASTLQDILSLDEWRTYLHCNPFPKTCLVKGQDLESIPSNRYVLFEYDVTKQELFFFAFDDADSISIFPFSTETWYRCIIKRCNFKRHTRHSKQRLLDDIQSELDIEWQLRSHIGFVWVQSEKEWSILWDRMREFGFPSEPLRAEFFLVSPLHYLLVESHTAMTMPAHYQFPPLQQQTHPISLEDICSNPQYDQEGILLQVPRESFDSFVDFVDQCCTSDRIHSIGITLYRVANHSKIIDSLEKAILKEKAVTVYLELNAREDEIANQEAHRRLEQYIWNGFPVRIAGHSDWKKVHAKMFYAMGAQHTIVSVGTGNYNETTASQYVDLHYITRDRKTVQCVMNTFVALMDQNNANRPTLDVSRQPKQMLLQEIQKEVGKGSRGYIRILCNHLYDDTFIHALLIAAERGVRVELTVRTICGIREGMLTEEQKKHLSVTRVVGRFLEHARVYRFGNPDDEREPARYYLGSSDLLYRNLEGRLETLIPIPESDHNTKSELDQFLADPNHRNVHAIESAIR